MEQYLNAILQGGGGNIPQPSIEVPLAISTSGGDAGIRTDYARADHTHYFDFVNAAEGTPALNIPVILYNSATSGIVIQSGLELLMALFASQRKMNFALIVPPDTQNYPVIFTVSSLNTTTGELHLTGITGGVLYEATLLPGLDPISGSGTVLVGTLTQTNLVQP